MPSRPPLLQAGFKVLLAGCMAALSGCRDGSLAGVDESVLFDRELIAFSPVVVGGRSTERVTLLNKGKRAVPLRWSGVAPPFSAELPEALPAGGADLVVFFAPSAPGLAQASLTATTEDGATASVRLTGEGRPAPACPSSRTCHVSRFDEGRGSCVDDPLPNGTACEANNVCLMSPTCQDGRCVGASISCDDGDPCTVDTCNALRGCEHAPGPPCPGDGKCQVGTCVPKRGCVLVPAPDETLCGTTATCVQADVCISGDCVKRDLPDGFVCSPATPCEDPGRCAASVCQRSAARPLTPAWSVKASEAGDAGTPNLHDFVVEASGEVSLMGFFSVPHLRVNTPKARVLASSARRCILWNGHLACADFPSDGSGRVSLIELETGQVRWTFDLPTRRPDLAALAAAGHLFMARLGVLDSDRLVALFEGFPAGTPADTQCRLYFLVLLDAGGGLVAFTRIQHPRLEVCDHPHPYGLAIDRAGDIYLNFSPSRPSSAPLTPEGPSLLMAFSREATLKWVQVEEGVAGGELSTGSGVLFAERSSVGRDTATGEARISVGRAAGRSLVTTSTLLPAPLAGDTTVSGFSLNGAPAFLATLGAGERFDTDEARLARRSTSALLPPEQLMLTFTRGPAGVSLTAFDTQTGRERWRCPLSIEPTTPVQLLEVTDGAIVFMEGSASCRTCDPPFAQSRASFHFVPIQGLGPSVEPWVGSFGGGGHGHRENGGATR